MCFQMLFLKYFLIYFAHALRVTTLCVYILYRLYSIVAQFTAKKGILAAAETVTQAHIQEETIILELCTPSVEPTLHPKKKAHSTWTARTVGSVILTH